MKNKFLIVTAIIFFITTSCFSQTKAEKAVARQVESLKKAMIDADSIMLYELTATQLSYGHSSGIVDNQKEFVSKITSGKSDFVTIELVNQIIEIVGKVAMVRHKLNATINDSGKPGEVHLNVLLIWQKQSGTWKLLARQAAKQQM